jgi:hypothetical protein
MGQVLGLLALVLVVLAQLQALSVDFIWPRLVRGWEVRRYSAWERSALLSEGEDFLAFVSFLRGAIPESGKVVFPPKSYASKAGVFTELGFMKYFLFPRQVLNCAEPVEECVRSLTGPSSFIVAVGGFPPPEAAEEVKDYIPFQDGKGVYAPR